MRMPGGNGRPKIIFRSALAWTVFVAVLISCSDPSIEPVERIRTTLQLQHSEIWSKGNFELITSIYTEDYVGHFPGGQTVSGYDGIRKAVESHRASFPNWNERVLETIIDGDFAATRYRSRGTHSGTFFGIPATDHEVDILEASIYRMVDGRIAEQWAFPDVASLQQQISQEQAN